MTRFVAFRAFMLFMTLAAVSTATGLAAQVPLAEVLFLVNGALGGVMAVFAFATRVHAAVPVRVRTRR